MPEAAQRLAESLLKQNGHLKVFEVDPGDAAARDLLAKALEAYGCTVDRHEFSTRLTVTCPDEGDPRAVIRSNEREAG